MADPGNLQIRILVDDQPPCPRPHHTELSEEDAIALLLRCRRTESASEVYAGMLRAGVVLARRES